MVGGATYEWEIAGGTFTNSGGQNQNIDITWLSAGINTIKVKASNSCGFGPEYSIPHEVLAVPAQPSLVSGAAETCSGTQLTYSVENVPGVNYIFSVVNLGTLGGIPGSNSRIWRRTRRA